MKWTLGGFHLLGYSMQLTIVKECTKSVLYSLPITALASPEEEEIALRSIKDRDAFLELVVAFADFKYIFGERPELENTSNQRVFDVVQRAADRLHQCIRVNSKQLTMQLLTARTIHVHVVKEISPNEHTCRF